MAQFTDDKGICWNLRIAVNEMRKLKDAGVNIMSPDGGGIMALADDPVLLFDAIWVLIERQAIERGISQQQFYDDMTGDVIEVATNAMLDAIIDFFPQARRAVLQKSLQKSREIQAAILAQASAKLDAITAESFGILPGLSE
jgi:hypothetical protein